MHSAWHSSSLINGLHYYYNLPVIAAFTLLWVTVKVSHDVFSVWVALTGDASCLVKDWQA